MRHARKLSLTILTALTVLISMQVAAEESSTILVGTIAKNFVLKDLSGTVDSLAAHTGKPILLQLWATWCKDSKAAAPFIQKIYEEYTDQGLVVLTVSAGTKKKGKLPEKVEDVKAFMAENGYTFPVLLGDHKIRELYHAGHIPDLFLISKTGLIRAAYVEYAPGAADIEADLKKFLEEQR